MVDTSNICKICGKENKSLVAHVRAAHHMGMDEYKLVIQEDLDVTDDLSDDLSDDTLKDKVDNTPEIEKEAEFISQNEIPRPKITITDEERITGIIDVEKRFNENMTVGELLSLKGLTLKELGSIINQYQTGNQPHPSQLAKKNEIIGSKGAEKLLNQSNPTTTNLHIAETLVKKHGYEVTHITRNPKTWHLKKAE